MFSLWMFLRNWIILMIIFTIYGLILGKSQPWLFLKSTFPHTDADTIAHLLFVFVIHMRQQVKHEIKNDNVGSVTLLLNS